MQTVWKGTIAFGLVSIPVRLVAATEERDVSFRQVHREDGSRIRYKRVCEAEGVEVPYGEIAKGYELPTGEMVVITDEDLADLPVPTTHAVEVLEFVPAEQVDPVAFTRAYYAEPTGDAKPYVLLRDILTNSGKVAVVKMALRQRERLAVLRVTNGVLVVQAMLWPDEVRRPDFGFLGEDVSVRQQELAMAGSFVEAMTGDFDPSDYTDNYRQALEAVVEAKAAGHEVVRPPEPEAAPTGVVDLMDALRRSVEQAAANRGAPAPPKQRKRSGDKSSDEKAEKAEKEPAAKRPSRKRRTA